MRLKLWLLGILAASLSLASCGTSVTKPDLYTKRGFAVASLCGPANIDMASVAQHNEGNYEAMMIRPLFYENALGQVAVDEYLPRFQERMAQELGIVFAPTEAVAQARSYAAIKPLFTLAGYDFVAPPGLKPMSREVKNSQNELGALAREINTEATMVLHIVDWRLTNTATFPVRFAGHLNAWFWVVDANGEVLFKRYYPFVDGAPEELTWGEVLADGLAPDVRRETTRRKALPLMYAALDVLTSKIIQDWRAR
jgi:hypothetical protein